MNHSEGSFEGLRNLSFYYQCWLPEGNPKAVVLIVHGLGEHSGRYKNLVGAVVPRGYAVYALDHIGHGKSGGARCLLEQFRDFTGPLTQFYDMVRAWQPDKPIFLLGHSLGGLIASYYLLDEQSRFKGAVISAPAVKVGDNVTPATITVSKILSRLAPGMGVIALDPAGISRDPAEVAAYANDPLNYHGKIPARMGAEMISAMQRVTAEASAITLPILIIQGGADKMVDPGGAPMLHQKVRSADKTLKVYEGYYHEMFNERLPDREKPLGDVADWLDSHAN